MKARSKKFLSLLLATTMVFTLNTTVFAEEVAVDSVDDAVEATVDAVDEVAEEATVDSADVDATGAVDATYFDDHVLIDSDKGIQSVITFSADPDNKKDTTENVAKITNVDDPVSWNKVSKESSYTYTGYAADLIETVLTGSRSEDNSLVNDKTLKISDNSVWSFRYGAPTTDELRNFYDNLSYGGRTYDVIDLGSGSYLFVGYGASADLGNDDTDRVKLAGQEVLAPVFEYDGRQIDFDKSGSGKTTKSKREVLDVDVAVVKYEGTTLTEIPGAKVTAKVEKKLAKNATVSGETIPENYEYKDGDTTVKDSEDVYPVLSGATNPTFKISVTPGKAAKDLKKAIKDATKDVKYAFAIRQRVVNIDDESIDLDAWTQLFTKNIIDNDDTVSTNNAFEADSLLVGGIDGEDLEFDNFTLSKFTDKKVNLGINVDTYNGKTHSTATNALKAGTDYELTDGTLANETVKVLDFKGNYIYKDASTANLAGNGYKYAFRATPTTDGKKKAKTFRFGIYKTANDGFVYNVDDTAVDSVEEAF